jgi:hypothetical protein
MKLAVKDVAEGRPGLVASALKFSGPAHPYAEMARSR